MEFKIGDKVVIRKDLLIGPLGGLIVGEEVKYSEGKIATILEIAQSKNGPIYRLDIDSKQWAWSNLMLSPYELPEPHKDLLKSGMIGKYFPLHRVQQIFKALK